MKLIVAFCKTRGIGFQNTLPWKLKKDLLNFQNLTIGNGNNAVIMGKNTWESLPDKFKPLPKRTNIILTTKADYTLNTINPNLPKFFPSFKKAEQYCSLAKIDNIWIIGGEQLYKEALDNDYVDWIYTTNINEYYTCDTFFPDIPPNFIQRYTSEEYIENNITFKFKIFSRNYPIEFDEHHFPYVTK